MLSPCKQLYLQKQLSGINARVINRSVNLAGRQPTNNQDELEHPLTTDVPCIPLQKFDLTRRPVAFGRMALRKLTRELHSKDEQVIEQAVASVLDVVHNAERKYEAIKLKLPDRLTDLLQHKNPAIRERICMILTVLADTNDGREAVVNNLKTLRNLTVLLHDVEAPVKIKAAKCFETIALYPTTAETLVDSGFVPLLLQKNKPKNL